MHPFLPQSPLFRAYDIRGDYRYFTDDFVCALADAFSNHFTSQPINNNLTTHTQPTLKQKNAQQTQVVLGYDTRLGSLPIAKKMAGLFYKSGIQVVWLGLVTTPMMAFWADQYQGHGIMVTASHSTKHYTGIKWLTCGQSPEPKEINHLYHTLIHQPIRLPTSAELTKLWKTCKPHLLNISTHSVNNYGIAIDNAIKKINHSNAKQQDNLNNKNPRTTSLFKDTSFVNTLVIDCLNGATASHAHHIFKPYASKLIMLNDNADGNFPHGDPDPSIPGRLQQLQSAVIQHKAQLGIAFDGDGDRLTVIDNLGKVVAADNLLYLLAKTAITNQKTTNKQSVVPEVLFDVKCSHHLNHMLAELGTTPVMSQTGSSHMRKDMQTGHSKAIFAGELSGHFIFNDGYFINHDDGMYAALRLINWLHHQPQSLHTIISQLPTMVSTADIYIPIIEQQKTRLINLVNLIKNWLQSFSNNLGYGNKSTTKSIQSNPPIKLPKQAKISTIDGIRLDFSNGFGVIRPSNTSHCLTVRFAGNTIADIKKIQQQMVSLCRQFDEQLAKQVAHIQPMCS